MGVRSRSTPVTPCGHTPGKVYAGECCYRTIKNAQILEVSLVTNPVQKYSVAFIEGSDHDYALVRYVLDHLNGPFHPWEGEWTYKRHGHEHFSHCIPSDDCPCGSGLRYEECCLPADGVRIRHFAMAAAGPVTPTEKVLLIKPKPHS